MGLACPYALVTHDGVIKREGLAPLPDLSDAVAKSQRVVLLLAASDVTVLRVQVPPLSPAKLKAALPNLVEDRLISDTSGCLAAAGGLSEGMRTVAVVQRAWLDLLAKTFFSYGAHQVAAFPAQFCLPWQPAQQGQEGSVIAAISEHGNGTEMALRLSEQDGLGLAIEIGQNETAAQEVIRVLSVVAPNAQISLHVPQSAVPDYQEAANTTAPGTRVSVFADNWPRWIAGANSAAIDLMAWRGVRTGSRQWRAWRWPLVVAAAILAVNITALNVDWWRMRSEANSLRTSMIQIYKSAYPKETVIIDPIAQMQQKITIAKRDSGLAAADDFMALTAAFGEAWAGIAPVESKSAPAISALEYREHSLYVRLKPALGRAEGQGGEALTQQVKAALALHNLSINLAPAQAGTVVWQIRSAK